MRREGDVAMQDDETNDSEIGRALAQAGAIGKRLLAEQAGRRASTVGSQLADVSAALLEAGEGVRQRGRTAWIGNAFDYAATACDRASTYLQRTDAQVLATDFERYAQTNPAAVAAFALASGFVAARILRVSAQAAPAASAPLPAI